MSFCVEFAGHQQIIDARCVASTSVTSILAVTESVYFAVKHYVNFVANTMQFQIALCAVGLFVINVVFK